LGERWSKGSKIGVRILGGNRKSPNAIFQGIPNDFPIQKPPETSAISVQKKISNQFKNIKIYWNKKVV
jgi:hypothetical protein